MVFPIFASPEHFIRLERDLNEHGKVRFYFRLSCGKRIELPRFGTARFERAYRRILASEELATAHSRVGAPDSLSALTASYRGSAGYLLLRATTKQGYASRLANIENAHGQWRVSQLT